MREPHWDQSIARPPRLEIQVSCGRAWVTADAMRRNSASIGVISGEWKACETTSGCVRRPCAARRAAMASTGARAPAMTTLPAALRAAIETCVGVRGDLAFDQRRVALHRHHHAARGQRLHQAAARGDQTRAVFDAEHAGHRRRGELPHAVPDDGTRLHAPMAPQRRQRDFSANSAGCVLAGLVEQAVGGLEQQLHAAAAATAGRVPRRNARAWRETPARCRTSSRPMPTYCEPCPVNRKATRTRAAAWPRTAPGGSVPLGDGAQLSGQASCVGGHQGDAVHEVSAAGGCGGADVGQPCVRDRTLAGEEIRMALRRLHQSRFAAPRQASARAASGVPGWSVRRCAGASSRMACAFMPLKPNALTPARRTPPAGAQSCSCVLMRTGKRSHGIAGVGCRTCRLAGSCRCCIASTTLIRPVTPLRRLEVADVALDRSDLEGLRHARAPHRRRLRALRPRSGRRATCRCHGPRRS